MNCILFVVRDAELKAMHQREWIYEPIDVSINLHGIRLNAGKAILYAGKAEHLLDPVRRPAVRLPFASHT